MKRNRHGRFLRGRNRAPATRSDPDAGTAGQSAGGAARGLAHPAGWAIAVGMMLAGCAAPGRSAGARQPAPARAAEPPAVVALADPPEAEVKVEAPPPAASEQEIGDEGPVAGATGRGAPNQAEDALEFPWPPAAPSARSVLPSALFEYGRRLRTLGDADGALGAALALSGYVAKSYYRIPGGFALVTQLEQIDSEGRSRSGPDRWFAGPPRMNRFSLEAYQRALLTANPGHYRLLVFIVTDAATTGRGAVSPAGEQRWFAEGADRLPKRIASQPWTPSDRCLALIYEFEWDQDRPYFVRRSRIDGNLHLDGAGLWAAFASPAREK